MDDSSYNSGVKVSIIIPVYNAEKYVGSAIDSALTGQMDDLEILVIDDGSTDSSASVISEYTDPLSEQYDPRVRYEYQENQGKSAAVNAGFESAEGHYITILDADDQLPSKSLSYRYNALEEEGHFSKHLAIGEFDVFDERGDIVGHRCVPCKNNPKIIYKKFYRYYKSPFHTNACLFSHSLCEKVGLFDTRLRRCQDIDYSLRLLRETDCVAWVSETVYRYRKHRNSLSKRLQVRRKTLMHRPIVYWKNYLGWRRYFSVLTGLVLDFGKLVYELAGNYES
jgi:glycosyltransferase involved in cell wall biosynthesis